MPNEIEAFAFIIAFALGYVAGRVENYFTKKTGVKKCRVQKQDTS